MNTKTIASALVIIAATGYPSNWAAAAEDGWGTTTRAAIIKPVMHDESSYLDRIEPDYMSLAGSRDNLASIASGLRTGGMITLQSMIVLPTDITGRTISFIPPTRPMGYGNITLTLDLVQRELASVGINSPTPEQLKIALMGGTVIGPTGNTALLPGVLQLRSQGMGWGQIAQTLGIPPAPKAQPAGSATAKPPVTTKSSTVRANFADSVSTAQSGSTLPRSHIGTGASSSSHGNAIEKLTF